MKKTKILMVLLSILCCVACTNDTELNKSAKLISNKIVESLTNENINLDKLTEKEKEIVSNFIENNTKDNYIVNLDEIHTYNVSDYYDVSDVNDKYVHIEDGKHIIKYNDIEWTKDYYATILVGKERRLLYKNVTAVLRDDSIGDIYNTYSYDFSNDYSDRIEFYYKSLLTTDGLMVRIYKEKNEITKIYVIPETEMEYKHEPIVKDKTKRFKFFSTSLIVLFIVIVFLYAVVRIIKR